MSWTPPDGNKVPLALHGHWTAPDGNKVPLTLFTTPPPSNTLGAIGFDASAFGTPGVANKNQYLAASGWDSSIFGAHKIKNITLFPTGFSATLFGNTNIILKNRPVGPVGFGSMVFGTAWISYFNRTLAPTGIKQDAYGSPTMGGGVRQYFLNGFATQAFGTAVVTLAVRQVYPTWFVATYYGRPMMGYDRTITGAGFDATLWGDALVWDNTQRPAPQGFDASAFGTTWIARYTRSLQVKAFADGDLQNIGFPKLHNLRQYITNQYIAEQWIEGGIGDYQSMFVHNVNRKIDLVNNGIAPLFRQIPLTHEVTNNARVLYPGGMDATLWGVRTAEGGTFIAPRIRSVYPQGFLPAELSSRFHIVRNAAFAPIPVGWDSSALGVPPLVWNTRRYFSGGYTCNLQTTFGTPFVAPRVRTIGPQNPLDPVRGIIGGATVWFRVRNLTPAQPDFGWGAFGKAALDTHWNIVAAKSIPPSWQWGYGAVRNNTPEITPYWDSSLFTLFGQTAIFNRYNPYNIEGWHAELWGPNTIITYRTKRPIPTGFDAFRGNPFHTIRNVNPDPPGQQYAIGCTLGATGALGSVYVTNLALYPPGIFDGQFGQATVLGMSLFPKGIPPFISDNGTQFGIPSVPGTQYATVPSIPNDTASWSGDFGSARMTPWTIWAPSGAPPQAVQNNPGGQEVIDTSYVGNNGVNTSSHPWFGLQRIELKNRVVTHYFSGPMDSYGQPRLSRNPQYVNVDGMKFTKYGFPVLFGGNRAIQQAGFDLSSFGQPTVKAIEPFIRYLKPTGASLTLFGATWVANFIRYPGVTGMNATLFGGTWIHPPPPPAYPPGLDATLWGRVLPSDGMFIAYRIRHLDAAGVDSFVSDYTLGYFPDRMNVRGRSVPKNVSAGDQAIMGTPTLNAKDRNLGAATILPPANQVPMPTARRINRVSLVSLGTLTGWGEPWALPVTEGTVQPRGEDFEAFGQPQVNRQVFLEGWEGAMGEARVAQPVGVPGLNTSQFGEMVLMGFGCGRQARVMIGFDAGTFGDVGIAQG